MKAAIKWVLLGLFLLLLGIIQFIPGGSQADTVPDAVPGEEPSSSATSPAGTAMARQ
jgi:hypothetical protein